ncbi:MAG: PAS domain-containing protein [Acidobacteriota bacterium]
MPAENLLCVLLVDTDRGSATRLAHALQRANPRLLIQPVGTTSAALDVLGRKDPEAVDWDALLCTVGRRHPEALEFVRRLTEGPCALPILLIGEKTDLEDAVEGLKAGASDFLLRGAALGRKLGPCLRQALDRTRANARRCLLLPALDMLPDAVLITDACGRILAANAATGMILSKTQAELTGVPFEELFCESGTDALRQKVTALPQGGTLQTQVRARCAAGGGSFATQLSVARMPGTQSTLLLVLRNAGVSQPLELAATPAGPSQ